ncbi:CheR family methyltransferase [Desulfamplus magnetovallimortis]|nr:CheR family methyltransferase [Desulfamplus magnetovallimortis]
MLNHEMALVVKELLKRRNVDLSGCCHDFLQRQINGRLKQIRTDYKIGTEHQIYTEHQIHTEHQIDSGQKNNPKHPIQTVTEYYEYLQSHPEELEHLIDSLIIQVSSFFRDPLVFNYLFCKVLPEIIASKSASGEPSIRIWSAGCATGEEAYSIAMQMGELLEKSRTGSGIGIETSLTGSGTAIEKSLKGSGTAIEKRLAGNGSSMGFTVFATDINEKTLDNARKAVYAPEHLENMPFKYIRHFNRIGNGYSPKNYIKQPVTFSRYDLLDKKSYCPPESVFGGFDLVLCRNLLIYYNTRYQNIIFTKLHRSLNDNGYLVLGETEMPTGQFQDSFTRISDCCQIFKKINI